MSGGQKQRIAIARALVKKPQILLLDEATSALDNESEQMVQTTLDGLQASTSGEKSLTTISIAHRLTTVRNSDVIFVLKNGLVCEEGSHTELMEQQGEYFILVQSQDAADVDDEPDQGSAPVAEAVKSDSGQKRQVSGDSKSGGISRQVSTQEVSQKDKQEAILKELKEAGFKSPTGRLFKMMMPQWPLMAVALLLALIAGSAMPINGRGLSGAMNTMYIPFMPGGTNEEMMDEMNTWILLFSIVGVASMIGEIGKYAFFNYAQECLTLKLRKRGFSALICMEIGFFDDPRNGPAGLVSMLAQQTALISQSTGISFGNVVASAFSVFVGIGIAFFYCWQVTLCILGAVPFVMAGMMAVMKVMLPTGGGNEAENSAYHASYEAATEAVINIRTVRALVSERYSVDLFSKSVQVVAKKECATAWKKGFAFGFGNASMFAVYIVAFGSGAKMIDDVEGVDAEGVFSALFCVMFGVMGAGLAAAFMPNAAAGQVAAYETFRIIDRESTINALVPTGTQASLGDGNIVFENCVFTYPHRPELVVLQSLNLTITRGTAIAFVGPSGCGKSTMIQMMQRFYDPTSGDVKVGGVSLRDFDVAWWRRQLGFVGQEPVLFDVSLEDNVKYGKPDASRDDILKAAKIANMDYVESGKMTWEDRVGPRGGKLSGGQKQRCAIARALLRDPAYLLLDEATSALDSASEQVVQAAIDAAKEGRTTIAIAHRLSTIRDSNAIHVFQAGQISESGTHEELLALQGTYWNLNQISGGRNSLVVSSMV